MKRHVLFAAAEESPAIPRLAQGARLAIALSALLLFHTLLFISGAATAQSVVAPTTVSASTYSKTQLDIAWNDPNPDQGGPQEGGYIVERVKGTATNWSKVFTSGPNVTSWSNTGLSTGTSYSYRVRAFVVVAGQTTYSAYSPIATGVTQSSAYPNPPTNLAVSAKTTTTVSLKWQDKANNETGYEVERAPAVVGPWTPVGYMAVNTTTYVDVGLPPATTFAYRVRAVNATGESAPSNVVTATTSPDVTPPTVGITSPASGSTYTTPQNVTINVNATDGVGVTKVELYDHVSLKATLTTPPYTYAWPVTSNDNGSHSWTAIAYDSATSKVSAAVILNVNIDNTTPVGALAINGGAAFTASTAVTLSLSATDAVGVTGYYVSSNPATPAAGAAGWTPIAPTPSYNGSVGYSVPAGDGSKTVYAWFKDAFGNVSPAASDSIVLDQTMPTNGTLSGTPGAGQIGLSWSGFADAGSGVNANSYKLVVSTGASTVASCAGDTTLAIGNATTYTHSGLTGGITYQYRVCASDNAGNVASGATFAYTVPIVDGTPPSGSVAINSGAAYTGSTAVTLTLNATDAFGVTGYYVSNSSTPPSAGAPSWSSVGPSTSYNGSTSYTLAAGDGSKTVYVWYKDAAGNVSATASASITLDQTAPSNGTINSTPGTNQVTLSWSGFADAGSGVNASSYKLVMSTGGATTAACTGDTVLTSGSATSYTHTGLTGGTTYSYRVCASDNVGNVASGATASYTAPLIDATAPTGTLTINGGAAFTGSTAVTLGLSASDAVGVTGYYVSTSSTAPAAGAGGWNAVGPATSYNGSVPNTLGSGDGGKTLYVWYKDAAGNVSTTGSASITLDQTGPTNGTLTTTPGTNQVTLSWSGFADAGSGLNAASYKLVMSTAGATAAACSGDTVLATGSATSYIHTGLTGGTTYSYRVCVSDSVANVASGATASYTAPAIDATAPTGTLTINSGAAYTGSTAVTLGLNASDAVGVTGYYVSTSSTAPAAGAGGWNAVGPSTTYNGSVPYALGSGDGSKTVYAWYKDAAGNVSNTASASISLDQTAPTNGTLTATPANSQVALSWSGFADGGSGLASASYKLVMSTAATPAASCAGDTVLTSGSVTSYTHSGLSNGTTYYYRVCVTDNVGNVASGAIASATPVSASDTTAPTGTVVINGGATHTGSTAVTLTLTATDNVGVAGYFLALGPILPPAPTDSGWTNVTPSLTYSASVPYTVSAVDGTRTVYVYYKDAAGNVSPRYSDTIVLDRTAPTDGTLTGTQAAPNISLSWSGFSDGFGSGLATTNTYTLVYATGVAPASCASGNALYLGTGSAFTHTNLVAGTTYYYRVCAADQVGNLSAGATASAIAPANQLPVAKAGRDQTGAVGTPVYFDAAGSLDPDGYIANYRYAFGDGLVVSSANAGAVSHAYLAPGTYTMTLTVTDNLGGVSTDTASVTIVAAAPANGNVVSVQRVGGPNGDVAYAVAADNSGNVIVTGSFAGTADFGGTALTSADGSSDMFIAKYSSTGALTWVKRIGGTSDDRIDAVAVDGGGNIFVSGFYQGSVDFGNGVSVTSFGNTDGFIAKYSADGAYRWSRTFGNANEDVGLGIAVDASGDVVLTGSFIGGVNLGGGSITGYNANPDVFVAKYAGADGAYRWGKALIGAGTDVGRAIAVDSGDGSVVLVGTFQSTLMDSATMATLFTSAGSADVFMVKMDAATGAYVWAKRFGGSSEDIGYGLAIDNSGNIVVTGYFQGTTNFGGGPVPSVGLWDSYVAKFSPLGNYYWARTFGGTGLDAGYSVVTDTAGNIAMVGAFQGSVDFGRGSLTSAGQRDIVVAKYTGAGAALWTQRFGSTEDDLAYAVGVGSSGNAFVVGYFQGSVSFGSSVVTSAGFGDGFYLNLGP